MAFTTTHLRNLVAFIVFAILVSVTFYYHELWRDEWQAFGIARNSQSLAELMHNKAYEGHPLLWFLLLFGVTRLTTSPVAMQVLHLLIALGGMGIFLRYFPGKAWLKYLLLFGYFFVYEYTVISRNYGMGYALAFAVLAAMQHRRWWLSTLLLCLLMQTNVFGLLLAAALLPVLLWLLLSHNKPMVFFTASLFLLSAVFFWITVRPPADSGLSPGWSFTGHDLQNAFNTIWDVFVPLPKAQLNWWNSNLLGNDQPWVKTGLALALVAGALYTLRKSKMALLFFISATLLVLLFLTTKYLGFVRHQGHYFIAFVMALWLAHFNKENAPGPGPHAANLFTAGVLGVQCIAGLVACYMDWQFPFSNSTAVANYITRKHPAALLAAAPDYIGASVGICLNRDVYYPSSNRWGQFIIWDNKRLDLGESQMISLAGNKKATGEEVLLLSGAILQQTDSLKAYGFQLIDSFAPTIVKNEQYFIYR